MLIQVRAKDMDTIVFKLRRQQLPYDLSAADKVILRRMSEHGVADSIDTDANPTELAITNAADGEVTLTPAETFWAATELNYEMYFEAVMGDRHYYFPSDDIIVVSIMRSFT